MAVTCNRNKEAFNLKYSKKRKKANSEKNISVEDGKKERRRPSQRNMLM